MAQFVKIGSRSELPPTGEAKEFMLGEKVLCVANVNGEFSAMDNVCLHRGGPLGQGVIEGDKIICPWHGWQFDAKSGAVSHNPEVRLKTHRLRVDGDEVWVEV